MKRLRRLLGLAPRREPVHRSFLHPPLGELRFVGTRESADGRVSGYWEVTPAGLPRAVSLDLETTADGSPAAGDLAWLEAFFGSLDAFYTRIRPSLAAEYEHWVGGTPPTNWRAAFRLDSLNLPGWDDEDLEAWEVSYWCERAQHWFVIGLRGNDVLRVDVEG